MNSTRQRVLFVSRNLPPLTGGMERLNHQAYLALSNRAEVAVCGPAGVGPILKPENPRREVAVAPLMHFLPACQWSAWSLARKFRPDVVFSGSGLTVPAAMMAARSTRAAVVAFLHGLDIVVDHPAYRAVFLPLIRRCDRLLVNSRNTHRLAVEAGIEEKRLTVVHPGVDIPDWRTRTDARASFRRELQLGDRPVLLAAGRLTARKGLVPFIREAFPRIRQAYPGIAMVIVGGEASQALKHRQGVTAEIQRAAESIGARDDIRLLGNVSEDRLTQAYFGADLLVFPVIDLPGDVEGFGMVAVEAAAHGLPTVAFAVGGVVDAVREGHSGYLVEPGNYQAMAQAIVAALTPPSARERLADQCLGHARAFTWDIFAERLVAAVGIAEQAH
jgi:phosphatidyl-myo-inositol dimannoside synthase